jgi:two-component system invasion response regulator UvrY
MNRAVKVAYADDHKMFRNVLAQAINESGAFDVTIEADNGKMLIEMIFRAKEQLEICILDINMPEMNGYDTVIELKKRWPEIKIIALTMFDNPYSVIRMLVNGAGGYLCKTSSFEQLLSALHGIHKEGYYYTDVISSRIFNSLINKRDDYVIDISDKEKQLLILCCTELSYKQIGEKMGINVRNVERYKNILFEKFHITSRIGLVVFAIKLGLVPLTR